MGNWQDALDVIHASNRSIEIIEGNAGIGQKECRDLNISEDSLLGMVVCNTAGIVIDNWLRILGQAGAGNKGISHYNRNEAYLEDINGLFIVATDAIGGLFAIDINRFSEAQNLIWYFAPDTLEWECLDMKYQDFFAWAMQGNLEGFYESMRWNNWKADVESLSFDSGILIYPFLWSKECDPEKADKKIVPLDEIIGMNFEFMKKLG